MLDSFYDMTFKLLKNHIFGIKLSRVCHLLCNVIMDVITYCTFIILSKKSIIVSRCQKKMLNNLPYMQRVTITKLIPSTVKPVLSGHSKKKTKLVFKTDYCLMQVKSIAECSKGSILQYFRPSLS